MGTPEKPSVENTIRSRIDTRLETYLPEQRLFLKSQPGTRFIRLRPTTQIAIMLGSALFIGWTVVVSAFFFLGAISTGTARDQVARSQKIYEGRIDILSRERDARARETERALERFYVALDQVSIMQSELLKTEERRRELERGLNQVQNTLRTAIKDRDTAREQSALLEAELQAATGSRETTARKLSDIKTTLNYMLEALDNTVIAREEAITVADNAEAEVESLESRIELMIDRNAQIFARLEEAVEVSLDPLNAVFEAAGMPTQQLLNQVRSGYSGRGGPMMPITVSTRGDTMVDAETNRANNLLRRLEVVDMYRIVAEHSPLDHPVNGPYRTTSGFGPRWGRMHNGLDFAGPHGTDIVATAEGRVTFAGWSGGYGKLVKIRHDFGFETRYAHLTKINVEVGQSVSRGQHIGDMGTTGRSTGTHLHYEIRVNGRPVNPYPFVRAGQNVF